MPGSLCFESVSDTRVKHFGPLICIRSRVYDEMRLLAYSPGISQVAELRLKNYKIGVVPLTRDKYRVSFPKEILKKTREGTQTLPLSIMAEAFASLYFLYMPTF